MSIPSSPGPLKNSLHYLGLGFPMSKLEAGQRSLKFLSRAQISPPLCLLRTEGEDGILCHSLARIEGYVTLSPVGRILIVWRPQAGVKELQLQCHLGEV